MFDSESESAMVVGSGVDVRGQRCARWREGKRAKEQVCGHAGSKMQLLSPPARLKHSFESEVKVEANETNEVIEAAVNGTKQ